MKFSVCRLPMLAVVFSLLLASCNAAASAAELAVLKPETWDEYAPRGKEVDCIYGDFVLRNDRIVVVVAQPIAGRNANMTVRNVGGAIIDLSRVARQNDQLGAFYPLGKGTDWRSVELPADLRGDAKQTVSRGKSVRLVCRAEGAAAKPAAEVRYTLEDGWDWVLVETSYANRGEKPLEVSFADEMRADASFEKSPDAIAELFWVYDKWFDQAYGLAAEGRSLAPKSDARNSTIQFLPQDKAPTTLAPGEDLRLARRLFPAATLLEVRAIAGRLAGVEQRPVELEVRDTAGHALAGADVEVSQGDAPYASGRTDAEGKLRFELPLGKFSASVSSQAHGSNTLDLGDKANLIVLFSLLNAGHVVAKIDSEQGGPIPCKVQFLGRSGTANPDFGHQTGEWAVRNVYYSENGRFRQPLPPGKYEAIVSRGPEHDAVFVELEIKRGAETPLEAVLVRSVQTSGWISADFHSHSSPSGDNTSSQLGRVLNLLCEHIEFAPCTEHNRLSTYEPHLKRLGAERLMATCTGIELTDSPLPLNHHNAFPLVRKPRTQDDGAPLSDADVELKIERLALWDGNSDKLVQQNHPDIGALFFDKDGDGRPDSGFRKAFPFMDVIEVHPPHNIFQPAVIGSGGQDRNNTIFNWLQLLNQGYRIPGVVNTDAHYNFHGSGFLRIYLESATDDPAGVQTLEMVHTAEHGHIMMTSGPYLEVRLTADAAGDKSSGTAGDDVEAPDGKAKLRVRVQCPNWFDVDRVQVFVNGRADDALNFTREKTPERFAGGTLKFDQELPLALDADAHVIVAAAAEKSTLGPVMGPEHAKDTPIAVSNPIFVDVDGGGFKPNGDTLGAPLPVASGKARPR
ncbi:MAG TPA: CehA/McbA family metallohydrolase [Pirellulales bacterium]|nr:CehA/McbA family metallohydrolase [Pirellulales bacterium]